MNDASKITFSHENPERKIDETIPVNIGSDDDPKVVYISDDDPIFHDSFNFVQCWDICQCSAGKQKN